MEVVRYARRTGRLEEGAERAEAREGELEQELALADAAELGDSATEQDETRFDETRLAHSGVEEGDGDVDVQELEEAGARLDDPERETPRTDLWTSLCTVQIMSTERLHAPGTRRARTSRQAPTKRCPFRRARGRARRWRG